MLMLCMAGGGSIMWPRCSSVGGGMGWGGGDHTRGPALCTHSRLGPCCFNDSKWVGRPRSLALLKDLRVQLKFRQQLNRMTQQQSHLYSSKTLGYMAADMTSRYEMEVCFSLSCTG